MPTVSPPSLLMRAPLTTTPRGGRPSPSPADIDINGRGSVDKQTTPSTKIIKTNMAMRSLSVPGVGFGTAQSRAPTSSHEIITSARSSLGTLHSVHSRPSPSPQRSFFAAPTPVAGRAASRSVSAIRTVAIPLSGQTRIAPPQGVLNEMLLKNPPPQLKVAKPPLQLPQFAVIARGGPGGPRIVGRSASPRTAAAAGSGSGSGGENIQISPEIVVDVVDGRNSPDQVYLERNQNQQLTQRLSLPAQQTHRNNNNMQQHTQFTQSAAAKRSDSHFTSSVSESSSPQFGMAAQSSSASALQSGSHSSAVGSRSGSASAGVGVVGGGILSSARSRSVSANYQGNVFGGKRNVGGVGGQVVQPQQQQHYPQVHQFIPNIRLTPRTNSGRLSGGLLGSPTAVHPSLKPANAFPPLHLFPAADPPTPTPENSSFLSHLRSRDRISTVGSAGEIITIRGSDLRDQIERDRKSNPGSQPHTSRTVEQNHIPSNISPVPSEKEKDERQKENEQKDGTILNCIIPRSLSGPRSARSARSVISGISVPRSTSRPRSSINKASFLDDVKDCSARIQINDAKNVPDDAYSEVTFAYRRWRGIGVKTTNPLPIACGTGAGTGVAGMGFGVEEPASSSASDAETKRGNEEKWVHILVRRAGDDVDRGLECYIPTSWILKNIDTEQWFALAVKQELKAPRALFEASKQLGHLEGHPRIKISVLRPEIVERR